VSNKIKEILPISNLDELLDLMERHGFVMLYPHWMENGERDFILKVPTPEQRRAIESV
jgi:hypothetical protein